MRLLICRNESADDDRLREALRREQVMLATEENSCDAVLVCLDGQEDMFDRLAEICRRRTGPVVVMGYQEPVSYYEEVRCLEMGADDYVRAGTPVTVLILRLQRMLRLYSGISGAFHYWQGFLELEEAQDYEWQRERMGLTGREYHLFRLLLQSRGQMVPSEQIMEEVWQKNDAGKDVLNTMIRKLRRKLAKCPFRIENCYGRGYALKYNDNNCNI